MSDAPPTAPVLRRGIVLANWLVGGDPARLVDLAVAAEESGWDGVFLADHLVFPPPSEVGGEADAQPQDFPDPWITLAAIASRTRTVRLGTWITPVARRQPWQMSRDLATLDRLSGARVILGVGLGRRPDYERFGRPWDLKVIADRCDEALDVITGLWAGRPFSYEGDHFVVNDAVLLPTPRQQPRIPIVVGGLWPNQAFLHRGARWDGIVPHFPGDGVLPGDGVPPEQHVRAIVDRYHELGDEPGDILLLDDPPGSTPEYADVCAELGVTWLLTAKHDGEWRLDERRIREGPPGR